MQKSLYLFILLTICSAQSTYYITPASDTPCPGEPCHTLSESVTNKILNPTVNTTLVFLPGDHTLDVTISVANFVSLTLHENSFSLPEVTSRIVCTWPAGFVFRDMTELHISALAFISCGHKDSAAVNIARVNQLSIASCIFQNNTKKRTGGALCVQNSTLSATANTFQGNSAAKGGALFINSIYSNTVVHTLRRNIFQNNYANKGGALYIKNVRSSQAIQIKDNIFQNNLAYGEGGTVGVLVVPDYGDVTDLMFTSNVFQDSSATEKGGVFSIASHSIILILILTGCIFQNNFAGRGGVVYAGHGGIYILISNTFQNNSATEGGVLYLSSCDTTMMNNTIINNHAQFGGAIFSVYCDLDLVGDSVFENNVASFGGGMFLQTVKSIRIFGGAVFTSNIATEGGGGICASWCTFHFKGNITIVNNSAADGGGLLFVGQSKFYLQPNAYVNFIANSAKHRGGAVKVEEINPFMYCFGNSSQSFYESANQCFFQIQPQKEDVAIEDLDIQIFFENNTAMWAGTDVYGGSIDTCDLLLDSNTTSTMAFDIITSSENGSKVDLSSDPLEICICTAKQIHCNGSYYPKPVHPGGILEVPVITHGQRNGKTSAVIQVIYSNTAFATPQNTNKSCSVLRYTVESFVERTTQEMILYAEGPCLPTEKNTLRVYIEILPCPPGFQLSQIQPICVCTERLQQFTNNCRIDNKSLQRPSFAGFWVGYDFESEGLILHPHCPLDYCSSEEIYLAVDDSDKQCNFNRSGLLCGRCSENLSLALGSSRCLKCSNTYLALVFTFALAGIALVLLLLVLRLTVAAGTINGLIFYANIVSVNSAIFFQPQTTNILSVFIAWLNMGPWYRNMFL